MKCSVSIIVQLAGILLGMVAVARAELKDKRQIVTVVPNEGDVDAQVAATGFTGAVQSASKYFQYAHVPAKDHYEFGHKRGNEHHFTERHEKAHPHAGEFKTKVRWGDKHGGYGEHYWDYNHAGHGDDGHGDESTVQEVVHEYNEPNEPTGNYQTNRRKRQALAGIRIRDDVEFINDGARDLISSGITGRHGGNYRREPGYERAKREYPVNSLFFDRSTGRVHDYNSGKTYVLQPVDY